MLIKSLVLNNFRQFTGFQKINFSTDPERKVTFIMAESGVGKTTLIQSFKWTLYGACSYSKEGILNEEVKANMSPNSSEKVSVSVVINHDTHDYTITREQVFFKSNIRVLPEDSTLVVEYIDTDGLSKKKRGDDAKQIIKKIMQQDLFPYFFLEGESLTKVGQQMARGKAGSNAEFVKAIKGLLGFNFLYEENKHLKALVSDYDVQIQRYTSSQKLADIIGSIEEKNKSIESCKERIENIDKEIQYYSKKRDEINDQLIGIGAIENDQKRYNSLRIETSTLLERIQDKQKNLLSYFSGKSFLPVAYSLLNDVQSVMNNADGIDKGVPGMDVNAINYMLEHHKCICGEELREGSEHWKILNELLTYLPPNNIGTEIKTFSESLSRMKRYAEEFDQSYIRQRKDLQYVCNSYNEKVKELEEINARISNVDVDIASLKQSEKEYNSKITQLSIEKKSKENSIASLERSISDDNKYKEEYEKLDSATKKIQKYRNEAEYLRRRIEKYITIKEKDKREKLTAAINDIFKCFYDEKITFSLDSNYGVQIRTYDKELSEDFTSGGQDVAVALAFIGAIIKVKSEDNSKDEEMDDPEEKKEAYPLVMDAPTSNFGMKQMKSFSNTMPQITDQIIVFINDKDGPILQDLLRTQIGCKWTLAKEEGDSFHTTIMKGID